MKKLKKITLMIVTFIVTIPSKVFGKALSDETLYGVVNPIDQVDPPQEINFLKFNWPGLLRLFAIPIILLIGSFIYFKKSKKDKKIKLIVTTIILILALLYILIFKDLFFDNY